MKIGSFMLIKVHQIFRVKYASKPYKNKLNQSYYSCFIIVSIKESNWTYFM
jgi:hypothetical protein